LILVPFWTAGFSGRGAAWLPWQIREIWSFSQLFTEAPWEWRSHHVQVLGADDHWREVSHDPPLRHVLFGRLTRLDMILLYFSVAPKTLDDAHRQRRVYGHLCRSYARVHATADPPPRAVRLITVRRPSHLDAPPEEPWSSELPQPLPDTDYVVLRTCPVRSPRAATSGP